MSEDTKSLWSRRKALRAIISIPPSLMFLSACDQKYVREAGFHKLGMVQDLLLPKQHLMDKSLLVFRDNLGWSVLNTQCTRLGCDLTYQEHTLYCSCCESLYNHRGEVLRGPAKIPLPWWKVRYQKNHLFAATGKKVATDYRFTTEKLETAITSFIKKMGPEYAKANARIPSLLMGKGDNEVGRMFRETSREELFERQLARQGIK